MVTFGDCPRCGETGKEMRIAGQHKGMCLQCSTRINTMAWRAREGSRERKREIDRECYARERARAVLDERMKEMQKDVRKDREKGNR